MEFASLTSTVRACPPAALALLAGLALAGTARADFVYNDFSSTAGLTMVHSSFASSGVLRLTNTATFQAGVTWTNQKVTVADGFTTMFKFRITNPGGTLDPAGAPGGDGFTFAIQNMSAGGPEFATAITGGGLGFNGMSNTLAVTFDTWMNTRALDPDANHISIITNGTGVVTPEQTYSLGLTSNIADMSDGNVHQVKISYTPGTMKVYMDNMSTPAVTANVNLATKLALDTGRAWVGFTAATGGAFENHDILDWSYSVAPSPGAAALLGAGVITAGLRRRR